MLDAGAKIDRGRKFRKPDSKRSLGRCGYHQREVSDIRRERAGQQRGRSPEMGQRYPSKAASLAQRGNRQLDTSEQVARLQHVLVITGDEVLDRNAALAAVA